MPNRSLLGNRYIDVTNTAVNELANKPRYDINGKRYGNTLSDDMFAIKNAGRLADNHTPKSYEYFNESKQFDPLEPMTPVGGWDALSGEIPQLKKTPVEQYLADNPYLKYGRVANPYLEDHEERLFGRQKVLGDPNTAKDWEAELPDGWSLVDDILEFPDAYTQDQLRWAEQQRANKEAKNRVASLGTDDLRAEKLGNYEGPSDWVSRRDAEYDYTVGADVNYNALSPATIEQLAKMGVDKPVYQDPYMVTDDDAAETLNSLLNAYRRINGQLGYGYQ